jgi:hypothetical protein
MQRIEAMFGAIRDDAAPTALGGVELDGVQLRTAPGWLQRLWPAGTTAVTLRRTIYFHPEVEDGWTDENLARLLAHELAHVRQFRRLGVGPFVIRYTFDYLKGRRTGLGHRAAYAAIELEVEAREAEAEVTGEG